MAGQGGLNRDLSRFRVADFSDHYPVTVVSQNRPKSARERESFFFVHRDLDHPRELILNWILDRNELVFFDIHLCNSRIQGRGFSASGRTGNQHHPVGFGDGPSEPSQVFVIEAETIEAQGRYARGDRPPAKEGGDDAPSKNARKTRPRDSHVFSFEPHPETAVLRTPPFRNIEIRHDLQSRNQWGVQSYIKRFHGGNE